MYRLFEHLLPRSLAWRITTDKTLRRFMQGLAGMPADVRAFIDLAYLDLFPEDTRELATWGTEFALSAEGSEATRRLRLAAAWRAQGGQSPDYLQTVVQAAGFTSVFVHEWWESGPPYVARDPRTYTTPALIGYYQCEDETPWECFAAEPPLAPHCDDTLGNDPGYLVNLDLTRRPPPPVPDDPSRWPYFLYFAGETFPDLAPVDVSRVDELKELLLRLSPNEQWLVLLIAPIAVVHALRGAPGVGLLLRSEGGDASLSITDSGIAIEGQDGVQLEGAAFEVELIDGAWEQPVWRTTSAGAVAKMAFFGDDPVARPSITGVTTQQQIDSIVAALGTLTALGLVTDDR